MQNSQDKQARKLCRRFLPQVSRTFALSIPVLREPLQSEVGLAYLLCRIVDTIEDHPRLSERRRNHFLNLLGSLINETDWTSFVPPKHPDPHYQALLEASPAAFAAKSGLSPRAGLAIDECLREMTAEMQTFPGIPESGVAAACSNLEDLDRYCHAAAGTVGILLTRLFAAYLGPEWQTESRLESGRRFGLGLQITNVLKDQHDDRNRGVQYLPAGDFFPAAARALAHLEAALEYLNSIPPGEKDLRLFCATPYLLALGTIQALLSGRKKIDKQELTRSLALAREAVDAPGDLEALCRHALNECSSILAGKRSSETITK